MMNIVHFFLNRRGLLIALALGVIVLLLPSPNEFNFAGQTISLSPEGQRTVALLVIFVAIFVTEALPFGITIAIIYCWIVFFGIKPSGEAGRIFSHDAAWFLVGALMIASVLVRHNLHQRVLWLIMRLGGTSPKKLVIGIVSFCAISAMFIADHTIAAMMLPIGIAVVQANGGYQKAPKLAKLIMFSIAYGCSIGGLGTPSGGGRNVVMIAYLEEIFGVTVGYGQWMLMAVPITLIMIPITTSILLFFFKPEVTDLSEVQKHIRKVATEPMSLRQWAVIGIFLIILIMWITKSSLGIGMIALFGAFLYLSVGLADWSDYQRINWSVALLYFAAIGLGRCLIDTGAAAWLGAKVLASVACFGCDNGFPFLATSSVFMSLATETMADGPCVAALSPMLLEAAHMINFNPVVFGVAIAISSAFAFAIIIGTPPNVIVYGSGYVRAKDFLKVGCIVEAVAIGVLLLVVRYWWVLLGLI